ncbi:MAG: radical SAM protein [Bacillota bacterium]
MNSSMRVSLDKSIRRLLWEAAKISRRKPGYAVYLLRAWLWQRKAAARRASWERRGAAIPPFIILSVTRRCNLKCRGCYAGAHRADSGEILPPEKWRRILSEAEEMGISFALLAGGEPLLNPEILDIAAGFRRMIFPVFTNGQLLAGENVRRFKMHQNLIPVLSLEGEAHATNERRGEGVHAWVMSAMEELRRAGVFFGASLTLTGENFAAATGEDFIRDLLGRGCKFFIFVEYVPVQEGTEKLVLTGGQRASLEGALRRMRRRFPALFIAFPGDEELFGGCLAAGRGFVHINPEGALEPCPFAPYSDANLKDSSLSEALKSGLLAAIRANHGALKETAGGCALWDKRDWVKSLEDKAAKR